MEPAARLRLLCVRIGTSASAAIQIMQGDDVSDRFLQRAGIKEFREPFAAVAPEPDESNSECHEHENGYAAESPDHHSVGYHLVEISHSQQHRQDEARRDYQPQERSVRECARPCVL